MNEGRPEPFSPGMVRAIEQATGKTIAEVRATPLAELYKEAHSRPGPPLWEVISKYEKAWVAAGHVFGFTLMLHLWRDLKMRPSELLNLRADFLSVEGDDVPAEGFWCHLERMVRSRPARIGLKYKPFWMQVFPTWHGWGAHEGPCSVISSEASRLNFALAYAALSDAVLP